MSSKRPEENIPAIPTEEATDKPAAESEPEQTGAEKKDESPSTNYGKYFEADKKPEEIAEGNDFISSMTAMFEHMENLQLDPAGKATMEKLKELMFGDKDKKPEEKPEEDKAETPENEPANEEVNAASSTQAQSPESSATPGAADTTAASTSAPPLPPRQQQASTETAAFSVPTASETPSKKEGETVEAAQQEEVKREVVKEGAAATLGAPRELTDPLVDKAMDEFDNKPRPN